MKQKETEEKIAKYTIKDSVFSDLFKIKKYLLQLYQALHPEDITATEDELTDITLRNVLTDNLYNDLGFSYGEKIFILVEVQSVWTVKGNSESAPLLPHLPMLLSQLVRWGLHPT